LYTDGAGIANKNEGHTEVSAREMMSPRVRTGTFLDAAQQIEGDTTTRSRENTRETNTKAKLLRI